MEFLTFYKIKKQLLFLFLFFSITSFSQKISSFSEDTETFLEELDEYLNQTNNEDINQLFKQISKSFKKGEVSVDNQKHIRNILNLMLEKQIKTNPYFHEFFDVILTIKTDLINKSKLSDWLIVSENILLYSSPKNLLRYCDFTKLFLEKKSLRNSKSVKWSVDFLDFTFNDEKGVPFITFSNDIDLVCSNRQGSFNISNVRGKYWIINNVFSGSSGFVDWSNTGWSKDSVYAHLSKFKIDVKSSEFKADSVRFYNKTLFSTPIIGSFYNKAVLNSSKLPIFKSYKNNIELKNILPDVDYKGGYTLRGKDFIAGVKDGSAKIIIKKKEKKILIVNSSRFNIKNKVITSLSAGIKIYFDEDSIYHPSLQFTYDHPNRKIKLYRDRSGISASPIYNSYHQITIDAELIEWQIDDDKMYIGSLPITANSTVNFESVASYNDQFYHSLRGIDKVNPIMLVHKFVKYANRSIFSSKEFAKYAGYSLDQIEPYLMNLANKGFLFYDVSNNRVTVQQKMINYVNAKLEVGDYDVIRFQSQVSQSTGKSIIINSSLNLLTKDLEIQGVETLQLSDSQHVYIQPYNKEIILKKNRDFDFSGRVSTGKGRFVLYGKKFSFKYNDFKMDLKQIDSIQLAVPIEPFQFDQYGNKKLVKINTVIQSVSGDLKIDQSDNKSGLKKDIYPEYPIFKSFNDSYVYYDRKSTFNGVYNRESFFFHLDTFEIDSLENFNGRGLRFPGSFQSSNIFPVFRDTLTMMNDYSLGFETETSIEGFDIYGGKSKYKRKIILSNEGLFGEGEFEYLNSETKSNEIYFFPDSMALFTQEFILNKVSEGIEFPQVSNHETFALYEPYNESYSLMKIEELFNFYNGKATFNGNITLKPTALTSSGIMKLENSEMESDLFTYNANWFDSDTADLSVFTELGNIAFKSNNLKTHIDLSLRSGDFYSNGKGSYVEIPANQYICYIDNLHWDMDQEILTLGDLNESSVGSRFVSVHPQQDSLSFVAKNSSYSLKDNIISVFNVEEIFIADAAIYPSSGFLIKKNAVIPTISNARILANTETKFHNFSNANIDIIGGVSYSASGDYTYIDALGEKQNIFFNEIAVNKDNITFASASLNNNQIFNIGSKFIFKGIVNLLASNSLLTFDGFFKVDNKCDLISELNLI